jgi:hypothetical protein
MELLRNRLDEVLHEARLLPVTTEETREMD